MFRSPRDATRGKCYRSTPADNTILLFVLPAGKATIGPPIKPEPQFRPIWRPCNFVLPLIVIHHISRGSFLDYASIVIRYRRVINSTIFHRFSGRVALRSAINGSHINWRLTGDRIDFNTRFYRLIEASPR